MPSRLTLINDELLMCGENTFSAPDDGSPEWLVCSAAYDAAVEHLLDEHDWSFAKAVSEIDDYTYDDEDAAHPDPTNYGYAYERPDDALHVIKVMDEDGGAITDWRIVGNLILVNYEDGIRVEHIQEPEPEEWPGLFVKALRHAIRAGIYRGLRKDPLSARAEEKSMEMYLAKARPRGDLEEPGKTRFVSTLKSARSSRRG